MSKGFCLSIGAGAIGKSMAAYTFIKMGYEVCFADIMPDVISDINRRGGYKLTSTKFGCAPTEEFIAPLSALHLNDEKTVQKAVNADYICTAVGPKGLMGVAELLKKIIPLRGENSKPLYVILFENDVSCESKMKEALGTIPPWLHIVKTSIERMSRIVVENGEYNVVAEEYIPVIATKSKLCESTLMEEPQYFMLVRDAGDYYFRKLYTNNLGHATLAYAGWEKGYQTTVEAMQDGEIETLLEGVLSETAEMLVKKFGFEKAKMERHVRALIGRYANQDLKDSLQRLGRDPLRKVGRNERIVGAIAECLSCGIDPVHIVNVFFRALQYRDPGDPSCEVLRQAYNTQTPEEFLQKTCGLSKKEDAYLRLLSEMKKQN